MSVARILVNGINAKSGGGKSILTNFLTMLNKAGSSHNFIVLVPGEEEYSKFSRPGVDILPMSMSSKTILFPFVNAFLLPYLVSKLRCDLVFNLSDVPMPTRVCQVFLFDWPYAAFPESPAWKMSNMKWRLIRKSKIFLFKKYLHYIDLMVAQTDVIKKRLERLYGVKNICVIPNAVSLDNLNMSEKHHFNLGSGYKLLCLSYYYSHKNIEVFLPLAKLIRANGYDIKIITTIAGNQGKGAQAFLKAIKERGLDQIVLNVGPVPMTLVPYLYAQTDGLLLPTLLESFSGTYVEAMFHRKPIFTSDLEFATSVCADAAYYFDPFNPQQILEKILESQNDLEGRRKKIEAGERVLNNLLTWEGAFAAYHRLFDKALGV